VPTKKLTALIGGIGLPGLLAASVVAAVPQASASVTPLPCRASMSISYPKDYTTTDVRVRTAARGAVTTVAHYKTVNRTYHRTANAAGSATVPYYISGATPGYKVVVSVSVKLGVRTGHCSTWFVPHR
jgi:hypothetical protein